MILVNPVLKLVILYHLLTTGVPDYLTVFIQILSQVIFLSLKFSRDLIQCTLNMMVSRSRFLIGSWRVHYGAHSTRAHSYFIKEVKILAVLCRIIKFLGIFRTLEKCRERGVLLLILYSCSKFPACFITARKANAIRVQYRDNVNSRFLAELRVGRSMVIFYYELYQNDWYFFLYCSYKPTNLKTGK